MIRYLRIRCIYYDVPGVFDASSMCIKAEIIYAGSRRCFCESGAARARSNSCSSNVDITKYFEKLLAGSFPVRSAQHSQIMYNFNYALFQLMAR